MPLSFKAGAAIAGQQFDHADFSHQEICDCTFTDCNFAATNFRATNLSGTSFQNCQFNTQNSEAPADFSQAKLREASFARCNLTVVDFIRIEGYALHFEDCMMQGVDLSKSDFRLPIGDSDLAELTIERCNLSFADLSDNYLVACTFNANRMLECKLDYCDLTNATLTENEMHNITAVGVALKNADLRYSSINNLDPRIIDLSGVTISPDQIATLLDTLDIIVEDESAT